MRLVLLIAFTCAAAAWPAAPAQACTKPGPLKHVQHSQGAVKVSWSPRAPRPPRGTSFRVLRNGAVVGQTARRWMIVRVVPGARARVRVGIVRTGGRSPRCWSRRTVRAALPDRLPAPKGLSIQVESQRRVVVHWLPVPGTRSYRVERDGRLAGQPKTNRLTVAVTPGSTHELTVSAVGPRERVGPKARVRHAPGVRAPGAPARLSAPLTTTTGARLEWDASAAGTWPIRGYRVFRDGAVVRQVAGNTADITGLVARRRYRLSVAAVDTRGLMGPAGEVAVETGLPPATRGTMHAFLLATTDASFAAARERPETIGVLYPTYFDCVHADPAAIKGRNDVLISQWAKDRRIKLLPRFNCQNPATLRRIFTEPAARSALLDRLVALAVEYDYDGINLDLEAGRPQDRDALTAFVAELGDGLHRAGRSLSLDVSPKFRDVPNHPRSTFFDYEQLARHADWIFVMSWGLHWATSGPGPLAPEDWLIKVYDYVAAQPQKHKFVMGLPLYGFDWADGGGLQNPATARSYAEIVRLAAAHGVEPERDPRSRELTFGYSDEQGRRHEVWFGDGMSIAQRFRLASERGLGGIGVWRLGQEDPALWEQDGVRPEASR